MFKKFNGANDNYIKEYEEAAHMELPKDYREFLLDTNGGCKRHLFMGPLLGAGAVNA